MLIDNYRPGVLAAMGFDEARLHELNPRLVRGSITGFGNTGPYRDRPSFDFIAQAMSGFMSVNGAADQPPMRSGPPVSDLVAGLYAALGIVAGLLREGRTGEGGSASVSLTGGLISFLGFMATDYLATGRLPRRTGNDHPIGSPYGLFRTADGEIAIAPAGEAMYQRLLRALDAEVLRERPEFATNALRAENRAAINAEIEARTMRETSAHWIRVLNEAGVPCSLVMDLEQVFADPQVIDQQAVVTVEHPGHGEVSMLGSALHIDGAPLPVRRPAPELGEHNCGGAARVRLFSRADRSVARARRDMTCIVGRRCVQPETACRPHERRIQTDQVGTAILRKPEIAGIVEGKVVNARQLHRSAEFHIGQTDRRRDIPVRPVPAQRLGLRGEPAKLLPAQIAEFERKQDGGNQELAKCLILHPRCRPSRSTAAPRWLTHQRRGSSRSSRIILADSPGVFTPEPLPSRRYPCIDRRGGSTASRIAISSPCSER